MATQTRPFVMRFRQLAADFSALARDQRTEIILSDARPKRIVHRAVRVAENQLETDAGKVLLEGCRAGVFAGEPFDRMMREYDALAGQAAGQAPRAQVPANLFIMFAGCHQVAYQAGNVIGDLQGGVLPAVSPPVLPEQKLRSPSHPWQKLRLYAYACEWLADAAEQSVDPETPLREQVLAVLTSNQGRIMEKLWVWKTATYEKLRTIPQAWQDVPSDDAVEKALKRIAGKLNESPHFNVTLSIQSGKRRVNLERPVAE